MSARLERAGAAVKLLRAGYTERFELGDDGVELDGGDPGLVALAGSTDTLTVLRYRVTWPHPHEPTPAHQERAAFPLEGCTRPEALTRLRAALDEVIAARLRGFQTCRYCQQSTPPEWWHGEGACSGCAERHLGVVH